LKGVKIAGFFILQAMGRQGVWGTFLMRYERYLFPLAVFLVLREVFATTWLANEDGPAHIYNSVVARELLFHPHSPLSDIFQLNHALVPNCLGHLILAFLTSFCSLDVSDKILHVIIIAGYCFSFRFLVTRIHPEQPYYGWLAFPFAYTTTFYLGFDNFSLGVVLFFLTTATWMWAETKPRNWRIILLQVFLNTLLFLTHLIPYLLFVLVVGGKMLIQLFQKKYREFFSKAGLFFMIIFPSLILFIIYYTGRTEANRNYCFWADPWDSFKKLVNITNIAIHDNERQAIYATSLAALLFLMAVIGTFLFFRNKKKQLPSENTRFVFWGCCWLFILLLVFVAPNDFGGAGALTMRLLEVCWIFLLLFLAAAKLPKTFVISMAAVSLFVAVTMTQIRQTKEVQLNDYPKKVMRLAPYIAENSTGVFIPIASNWPFLHIGELAFAERKTAMLSNYETVHDFFPLLWQKEFPYDYTIGGLEWTDIPCAMCYWPAQENKPRKQIDYILLCKLDIGDSACYNRLNDTIQKYYTLKRTEEPFYLYQSNDSSVHPR
jgi:hypothetical protein